MAYLNWLGNLLIILGLWRIGYKDRYAFLYSIAGESLWTAWAYQSGSWSLVFICTVFNIMAVRNFILWSQKPRKEA